MTKVLQQFEFNLTILVITS